MGEARKDFGDDPCSKAYGIAANPKHLLQTVIDSRTKQGFIRKRSRRRKELRARGAAGSFSPVVSKSEACFGPPDPWGANRKRRAMTPVSTLEPHQIRAKRFDIVDPPFDCSNSVGRWQWEPAKNRTLFLGTADGLYRAEPDGEGYRAELHRFQRPVQLPGSRPIRNKERSGKLYTRGTTRAGGMQRSKGRRADLAGDRQWPRLQGYLVRSCST